MNNENKAYNILEMLKEANDKAVSKEELKETFDVIMQVIKVIKKEIDKALSLKNAKIDDDISKSLTKYQSYFNSLINDKIDTIDSKNNIFFAKSDNKFVELRSTLNKLFSDLESLKITIPSLEEINNLKLKLSDVEEKSEMTEDAISIRNKLEALKEDEKLEIEAIKDLRKELEELRNSIGKKTLSGGAGGGGGSTGARNVSAYDLSSSLNGVLKTFSLPAFWRVIDVSSSSFPYSFRPTVDYTVDASAMTITFTSEIEASTTLNTGQTLLVIYAE